MKHIPVIVVTALVMLQAGIAEARTDKLCKPLRDFVSSIKPNEKRSIEFHTSWGGNFKDSPEPALYAKRCAHNSYTPAKLVCDYLMEHGAVEFSGHNAQRVITCLSPKTRFESKFSLHKVEASFSYGTENRGSIIDLKFDEDSSLGGMVLKIDADGY